jgi:gluconolactonase
MRLVTSELRFPEGPLLLPDRSLLVAEMANGRLTRVDPESGRVEPVVECSGGPNGLALGPDGAVYVCNNGGAQWHEHGAILRPGLPSEDYRCGTIQRVQPDGTQLETLYDACGDHPLSAPNDIVFDASGGFWFTDSGKTYARSRDHGSLYYARHDGSFIEAMVYPLASPNGVGLAPDGRELYVTETFTGRVWSWPVLAPGRLGKSGNGPRGARLVHGFSGYQLLDSMAVDARGRLCVATIVTGAISVLDPGGALLEQVRVPGDDPIVTNLCFGGRDRRTAYITSSGRGRLWACDWSTPGLALAF